MKSQLRRAMAALAMFPAWFVTPSGLVFGLIIALGLAVAVGAPASNWLAVLALALIGAFIPYRAIRERASVAKATQTNRTNIDEIRALVQELSSDLSLAHDETKLMRSTSQGEMIALRDALGALRRSQHRLEQAIADNARKTTANSDDGRKLLDAVSRLRSDLESVESGLDATTRSLEVEKQRRVNAFASAVDELMLGLGRRSIDTAATPENATQDPLGNRRLIFCASSGRAGSHYIAQLLGSADKVHASHELPPYMIGSHLRSVIERPLADSYEERRIKAVAIRAVLASLPGDVTYAETNHMFIKTFHDVVLNEFEPENISVIMLRRSMDRVLKSIIELGFFSADNTNWPLWMHNPSGDFLHARPPQPIEELDEIDRAIGYLFDIEARQRSFVNRNPVLQTIETTIEDLTSAEESLALLTKLNLQPTERTREVAGLATNQRTESKVRSIGIDECRDRIANYHARVVSAGEWAPDLDDVIRLE